MKHKPLTYLLWLFVVSLVVGLACSIPLPTASPLKETLFISDSGSVMFSSGIAGLVTSDSGAQLEIPNGAVPPSEDGSSGFAEFSIQVDPSFAMVLPSEFTQNGPAYRLMPEGIAFGMPVKLTLPIPSDIDAGYVIGIATFDELSGTWQLLPAAVDEAARTVIAEVGHFSYYGIFGLSSYLESREIWANSNGGFFNIVNTARDGATTAPFGKPLPASVYYGVCVQSVTYDDPTAESWNWQRPTDWMIGATAQKNQDSTRKQWLPAGTYTLMEMYGIGETNNYDIDYYPQHRYYVRPMGQVYLGDGEQIDFSNPGALHDLEGQGFTWSRDPCWMIPMDTPPVEPGDNWTSIEVVNLHRSKTTKTHFGKRLPAGVYYGVCSVDQVYDDPLAETWNWQSPTNWMMGVVALGDRDARHTYRLPAGTYSLLEVYLLTEQENTDFDYVPQGKYYYRTLGAVRLAGGQTINYTSPATDPGSTGDWGQSLAAAGFSEDVANPCNGSSWLPMLTPTITPSYTPEGTTEPVLTATSTSTIGPTLTFTTTPSQGGCSDFTLPTDGVWNTSSWFDTGMDLSIGQTVVFTASGTVRPHTNYDIYTGPEGTTYYPEWMTYYSFRTDLPHETVLARIGGGDMLHIGTGQSISLSTGGRLELGVNDTEPGNNEGSFDVQVCW
jgi:hypothetical protein